MMKTSAILIALCAARIASAQGSVTGTVYDSLAHAPLAGAMVQLVAADAPGRFNRNANADAAGRFRFDSVPGGKYTLGFFHPVLDSLVLEAPLREVTVVDGRSAKADLAIPSAARLRAAMCAGAEDAEGAVVAGIVRNARDGSPVANVGVAAEWLEYTITRTGMARARGGRATKTGDNGWFALCNVPKGGTIALVAGAGADSTDEIELQVPADGFLRRELYLGAARTVTTGDTTRTDSLAPPVHRVHVGDVRLSGTVVTQEGARPVGGAQVGIVNGPRTTANERGEWTIVNAPAGTRTLEVRAVTYYPTRRVVDVVADAPSVSVKLATLKAVLDTVRVTASRLRGHDLGGFLERKRGGAGTYITEERIARRNPIVMSDVYKMVPGLRVVPDGYGGVALTMRGAFGQCVPSFFLDGTLQPRGVTVDDLDHWVAPERVAGVEIYKGAGIPPQFQDIMGGCGSIVVWTK